MVLGIPVIAGAVALGAAFHAKAIKRSQLHAARRNYNQVRG